MKKKTLKETIRTLESRLKSYKAQVYDLQIQNKTLKEKSSTELWPIKSFLDKFAKNVEYTVNKLMAEPGSLRIDIVPIENQYGFPLAGYRAEIRAEFNDQDDKDLKIRRLQAEVKRLSAMLLQQEADIMHKEATALSEKAKKLHGDDPTN